MIIEDGSGHLTVVDFSDWWRSDYIMPCACVFKEQNSESVWGVSIDGAVRTKNKICFNIHSHIPNAKIHVVNRKVTACIIQARPRKLACESTVIDAGELDTGRAVRACNLEIQGEALYLRDRKRSW